MENASKALLIAGGALVSILVITLFMYAFKKISEYQTYKEELVNVEDLAKFNEQFTVYDRQDLKGADVLSLINKINDYNKKYKPDEIKFTIHFKDTGKINLASDRSTLRLITQEEYKLGQWKGNVQDKYDEARAKLPPQDINVIDEEKANKIARNIDTIFLYNTSTDIEWSKSAKTYASIVGKKCDNEFVDYVKNNFKRNGSNKDFYEYACKCYEYMKFKTSIFKCQGENGTGPGMIFDSETGRVKEITIVFSKVM